MGTLRSLTNWSHQMSVNGVELGDPVVLDDDPTTFEWNDSRIPTGLIDAEGNVIPDELAEPS